MSLLFSLAFGLLADDHSQVKLWQSIYVGMSKDKVVAIYPPQKGKTLIKEKYEFVCNEQPIGKCNPRVKINFPNGFVTSVEIDSVPHGIFSKTCGNELESALIAQYGKPTISKIGDESTIHTSGRNLEYVWLVNSIRVSLIRQDMDKFDEWSLIYDVPASVGL